MTNQVIAHVDIDCFFAACELKIKPELKGKPVIVGGDKQSRRGVVCTATYEARKFGVHSAMPISRALSLCPDAICIPTTHELYKQESQKVMSALSSITEQFQQVSIDEAYLDITEFVQQFDSWERAGLFIQKLIEKRTGYTCSVGISESRKVAKIASDFQKPAGVTAVHNMKEFLAPLSVKKIPGIGKKSLPYYHKLEIETIGDLANKSKFFILDHFGMHGYAMWQLANGKDSSGIEYSEGRKSISKESTFEYDITSKTDVVKYIYELAKKVYENSKTFLFKTVSIKVRYNDFKTITRSFSFSVSTNTYDAIVTACKKLLSELDFPKGVRLLGVKLDNLTEINCKQMSLSDF